MLCPRSTLLVMLNLDNKSDHSVDFYCLRGQASPLMLEFWCIHFPKSSSFYFYPVQDKVLCQQDRMNFIRESEIFSNSYTEATSFLFHTPSCKGVIQLKLTSRIRCVAHCCCCKQNFIGIPPCSFITVCQGCFHGTTAALCSWNGYHAVHTAYSIYIWPFTEVYCCSRWRGGSSSCPVG